MAIGTSISAEQVKAEVARFWAAFTARSADVMQAMYGQEASVFASWTTRAEPGRLTVARREREYFQGKTNVRGSTGPVEVILLGEAAAVAVYTFQLHITNAQTAAGRKAETHIQNGRATQVFTMDAAEGKLSIVHEHLSVARE
jgi:ketosteroid isomerase-like protein